ncbi:hypothetical protein [Alkalicoccobacillus plakortidis]|uniref:Uncharacterized protein n=1 Tax=Alkalicoccobacillus plakortidis TaxID=444060 RepID=A0ABT0XF96_9BACI|nr:hypothetical protein [Alkalicoccobacillus plakortidis]MCM2674475.1 hypothetical protein [Alkalicoccobacillus plakortidis]
MSDQLTNGHNQSNITAKVAASIAHITYENNMKSGVYHIEQLFELVEGTKSKLTIKMKEDQSMYTFKL